MSVTDTIAAARRQPSPARNRIAARRTVGLGAERRRKNQSGGLSDLLHRGMHLSLFIEVDLLQRGFKNTDER